MASDRSQYNRALRKWDTLHEARAYSVPVDEGCVAILCSDYELEEPIDGVSEAQAFAADAGFVASYYAALGIESEIFPSYNLDDARRVLDDPEFASIVTIGNGSLTASYAHGGEDFDWGFVSENSSHLKTGKFIQRHCGHPGNGLPVPLGTFAMASHAEVFAAYNVVLPTVMTREDEALIQRLHRHDRLAYQVLKRVLASMPKSKPEDEAG